MWRLTLDTECMEISRTGSSSREYQLMFACSIDVRLKPITTSSHALSRAWGSLLVFTLNLIGSERYFSYLLFGLGNNFGFGFTLLNPKAPHFKRVFFSCRFNYTVASPNCKMNDLKQFLLELNQTNLSRKLDKRHHIVLQISSIFPHSTWNSFSRQHFIDHSNVTTAGFIELVLVTFLIVVRWHLDATWLGHCDGPSIAARYAIWWRVPGAYAESHWKYITAEWIYGVLLITAATSQFQVCNSC